MISIIFGFLFIVAGLWGVLKWFPDFLVVIRGFLPISLFFGGCVAVMAGLASIRPHRKDEKEKAE